MRINIKEELQDDCHPNSKDTGSYRIITIRTMYLAPRVTIEVSLFDGLNTLDRAFV